MYNKEEGLKDREEYLQDLAASSSDMKTALQEGHVHQRGS